VPVSGDRFHDGDDAEASSRRPLRAAPGLDRNTDAGGRRVEVATQNGTQDRVIGELATENADLYRRNADQAKTIERLQARLDMSEARFRAWAKEMANREDARAARDEARDKREEALLGRINDLAHEVKELRGANDGAGLASRIEKKASAEGERDQRPRPPRPSDQFIGMGAAVSVEALTAAIDPTPPNLLIGAVGIIGAGIPWMRRLKEDRDADRS
jgi:transposase-like protein